ncbi:MAG: protein kinase [Candidatus Eisenbacteria bacterium]|nr:protein kinase [Candidatus Eisenbacteria bacterium]
MSDGGASRATPRPRGGAVPARLQRALAGHYRLGAELGRGGMSTVYAAEDLKHHRPVAIKVLHPALAGLLGAERFLREIEIVAHLVHPNVVPLLDSGAAGDQLYYIMPYFAEGSLAAHLARAKQLPLEHALELARDVAAALHCAHGQGLVHRDIKPQNILLSGGRGLVADFGIARAVQVAGSERLTTSGSHPGTPLYMSPEQTVGGVKLDGRSDQYSLACVLYEMLAGETPFTGRQLELLAYQHRNLEPRPLRALRPAVPPAVAQAVQRALSKVPADRFETTDAFARALGPSPVPAAGEAPPAAAAAIPHNLPQSLTSFVGREEEIWECSRRILHERLVTLTGPGGCGKTRLAIRLGERLSGEFPDGVWFADLAAVSDPPRVPQALAAAAGVREEPGRALIETLKARFTTRRALVILDNCEHVLAASAQLARGLLAGCPQLHLLATSREALGLREEAGSPVHPLPLPAPDRAFDAEVMGAVESVRLFVERASAVQPGFTLTSENAAAIGDICIHLDGIPLALELAAARVRMLSVHEIRAKLDDRFRLLRGGGREALARHQTLQAAFQWSYDHLEPEEQRLFRALAVFSGGWELSAAAAVCADGSDEYGVLDLMTRLADTSLMLVESADGAETRYRYLETVRQYALERLEETGGSAALRSRHLAHFLARAEAAETAFWGPEGASWLARLERDHENLLAAIAWSQRAEGEAPAGLRLAGALYRLWYMRGHYEVGRRVLAGALTHPGAQEPTIARARALYAAAGMAVFQGDNAAARPLYEQSLAIHRALADRLGVARTLIGLGTLEANEGHYDSARELDEESLAIYRETGEPRSILIVLHNLGDIALYQRDYESAHRLFEESLARGRATGNKPVMATTLAALSVASSRLGRFAEARSELIEGLRLVRELKALTSGTDALESTAELALARGAPERAALLFGASEALREKVGLRREPGLQSVQTTLVARARETLGGEAFAKSWIEGRGLSFEAAVGTALTWLEGLGPDPTVEG